MQRKMPTHKNTRKAEGGDKEGEVSGRRAYLVMFMKMTINTIQKLRKQARNLR